MESDQPRYKNYVCRWMLAWLAIILLTAAPKFYEASANDIQSRLDNGPFLIFLEVCFALIWGSLSWLLQRFVFFLVARVLRGKFLESQSLRYGIASVGLLAAVECGVLGCPLASMSIGSYQHPFHIDSDDPAISYTSVLIEAAGIAAAFPVACCVAGWPAWRNKSS